jgi:hypothetical protein
MVGLIIVFVVGFVFGYVLGNREKNEATYFGDY